MTFVVAGALANKPGSGGEAWVRLSWVLGLLQLGLPVAFVEELDPAACVDEAGAPVDPAASTAVHYFRQVVRDFGLSDISTLLVDGEAVAGPPLADLLEIARDAVLVNISGHLAHPRLFAAFRSRVYVDIDPGFTQFWHALGWDHGNHVVGHDLHFTIGENIGSADCTIPTSGVRWRPVRQPVLLSHWPVVAAGAPLRFTTVASWRPPFGPIEYDGRTYGLKVHEFRKVLDLPRRSGEAFELALSIHPGDHRDLALLRSHDWHVVRPSGVTSTPQEFQRYVQGSGAEFSVAQGVYVDTSSGWFSDRTARYLASGKPVLVQETGFSRNLPVGQGLLSFRNAEEAVAGAHDIRSAYAEHAQAARRLAEQHFDSDEVLDQFRATVSANC